MLQSVENFYPNLVERGFNIEKGLLVVIDGSKALHRAVKDVFGNKALIQRCRVHKKKNVLGHLPKEEQGRVSRKLNQAWQERDFCLARLKLENLAKSLEKAYPGAAASIREGLTETLTINKLGIPKVLQTSLKSTNIIESAFDITRNVARNVKRWRNREHVLRWSAAGLMEAEERFRRIKGYRELPLLRVVLQRELNIDTNKKEVVWA
jgi:transposase-like protein